METFYASITNNLIFKGIKYKIGKRYPLINGKKIFHKWNDIDINNIYGKLSIYLVKVDKTNNYFKILKEINYSEFLKSKDKKENLISAIKNRDKWSLSKFSDTSDISQQVNTYIKNEKYLDNLIKLDVLKDLSRFSVKYLHNKYLDYLVENDDSCYDNEIIVYIANLGIPKYLDKFITNKSDFICRELCQIGRKKDLDILVKSKSEKIRFFIAYLGYDEHLDILVHDESKMVLQSVLDVGRDKDIDILRKSPYAKDLDFSKINTIKR